MKKLIGFISAASIFCAPIAQATTYNGLVGAGDTPTLGACGTGPTLTANSVDHFGTINAGTGLFTSCTINWSATLAGTVRCTANAYGLLASPILLTKTVSSTGMILTFVATIAGATIDYSCMIN